MVQPPDSTIACHKSAVVHHSMRQQGSRDTVPATASACCVFSCIALAPPCRPWPAHQLPLCGNLDGNFGRPEGLPLFQAHIASFHELLHDTSSCMGALSRCRQRSSPAFPDTRQDFPRCYKDCALAQCRKQVVKDENRWQIACLLQSNRVLMALTIRSSRHVRLQTCIYAWAMKGTQAYVKPRHTSWAPTSLSGPHLKLSVDTQHLHVRH